MKKKIFAATAALATVAAVAVPAASQARAEYCNGTQVSAHTSCAFAQNVVNSAYEYGPHFAYVYSPVTHRTYPINFHAFYYSRYGAVVTATGPNGIWLRFNLED